MYSKLNQESKVWIESYNHKINPRNSLNYLRELIKSTNVSNKHELLAMSDDYLTCVNVDVKFILSEDETELEKIAFKYQDNNECHTEIFYKDRFKKEALTISGLLYFKGLVDAAKRLSKKNILEFSKAK